MKRKLRCESRAARGSKLRPIGALLCCLWVVALTGCKSHSVTPYVSPRVTGRVLDAESSAAIPRVKVFRNAPERRQEEKLGQMLLEPEPTRTGAEGQFELASERSLSVFRGGWSSLMLRFAHPEYAPFSTNFTLRAATNLPSGEPWVDAGEIRLQRRPRPSGQRE